MVKPADKIVSLTELRFKPANSNDAARAVLAHHFVNVPRCSFAKDDGISQYLGSETGMDNYPASPDQGAPENSDVPGIQGETPEASGSLRRKLLRGGFALSVFLHAVAAFAVGFATLAIPDDPQMEEGITSVTFVVEGNADADARSAGAEEEIEEPLDEPPIEAEIKPVEKPVEVAEKPVEKPIEEPKPLPATTETILKDVPLPDIGADLPDVLTTPLDSKSEVEQVLKLPPVEEKVELPEEEKPVMPVIETKPVVPEPVEQKPVEQKPVEEKPIEQKPVEKQPEEKPKPEEPKIEEPKKEEPKKEEPKKEEPKKEEPKKQEPKKEQPKKKPEKEKPRQNRGNKGDQSNNARRGDVESDNQGQTSANSRGDSNNRELGNASRSNYKGLVNKKLSRAKGRVRAPAKGKVTVNFTILANGAVSGLKVSRSSGKPALDAAALKVVLGAAPFPAIPAETGKKSWLMTVPMVFK